MRRSATDSPSKQRKQPNAQKRRIGLDKPCRICGDAIYFKYRGPIPGVCGKCTDKTQGAPGRPAQPQGKT